MRTNGLSRRDFLKLSALALSSIAMRPLSYSSPGERKPSDSLGIVRIGSPIVRVYKEPNYKSDVIYKVGKDELVYFYEKSISPFGPNINPFWYQVEGGYLHTAYVQPVKTIVNEPVYSIPEGGILGEITVPLTQSMRFNKNIGWQPLYRLYYKSVHWITGAGYGPNYSPWYEITDDLMKIQYHVPAQHVRLIPEEELTPISPDVPEHLKRVIVNIARQSLTAFEGDEVVMHTAISSGIPASTTGANGIPTATPYGEHRIHMKTPVRHMGDANITSDINAYELPGVPWVSFFVDTGVAFHGTYWHDNYGNKMSHGCVNMRPEEAKWIYRWLMPEIKTAEWHADGYGSQVFVV